ncbi:hypothetical protein HJC23_009799 [Cyclotella cryptica]|uniref:Uncharacterized protein n=1 Tax=Cyclotella cryptica TaxID=29204 RepID=A0ABD3PSL6_9STRA|eukprot:CCRYP_012144-RA/>CCRYP_012144-RA protein AED:0.23 eAED:-0.34 QI:0/-1/0/1/-1/1/1/0/242
MSHPFVSQSVDTEIALALCNLGFDRNRSPTSDINGENRTTPAPASALAKLAAVACSSEPHLLTSSTYIAQMPSPSVASSSHVPPLRPTAFNAQLCNTFSTHTTASPPAAVNKSIHLDISARRSKKNAIKPRKRSKHVNTSITFEEMQRLMRVYGPMKCMRNRSGKESGKGVKAASILRKFYRWFPDFEERFVKTAEGWYVPKIGHENEIAHREMMRNQDEKYVVTKRNLRRYNLETTENPMN